MNADSLFVLSGLQLRAAPWDQVRKAQLTGYDPQTAELAVWSVLGTLSTASHGFVLIFTAPLWVISGAASTAKQSRAGVVFCPPGTAQDLAPYARFPQGLPAGVDRSRLGSVPAPVSARPADPFGEAPPTPAAEPGSPLLPRPRWSTDAPASA